MSFIFHRHARALLCLGISAPLATTLFPTVVVAQTPEATSDGVPTITVEASPFRRAADDIVQPVDVIAGEELDRKRRASIGEVLENEPGVATTDFGPGVGRPIIRGQGGARVAVLDNGIGAMDVSTLSSDHAVTIDPAHARQVEIIKGPATLMFGSGASAGVVNVVDDRLPDVFVAGLQFEGDYSYADNADERQSHLRARYGVGEVMFGADYAGRKAGLFEIPGFAEVGHAEEEHEGEHEEEHDEDAPRGILPNSNLRTESYGANLSWIRPMQVLNAAVSVYDSNYGVPGHAHGHEHEEAHGGEEPGAAEHGEDAGGVRIDMQQTRFDLRGKWFSPLGGVESLTTRIGVNDYEHTEIEPGGEAGTRFDNEEIEGRLELVHAPLSGWRGALGVQAIDRDFSAVGEEAFVPPVNTHTTGVFLVEERPTDWGRVEAGVRLEQVDHEPELAGAVPDIDFSPLSVSLGTLVELGPRHHLRLNLARAQRAPAAEEVYADGPHLATATFERGDLGLDEETANNVEIGIDRHDARWTWSANIFFNRIEDYVFLANADDDGDGIADLVSEEGELLGPDDDLDEALFLVDYAQADAEFYGFELESGYQLIERGPFRLDGRLFADSVRGELRDGSHLPRITPMRFGGGFDAKFGALSGSIGLTRVERQDRIAALETETAGYELLAADVAYTLTAGDTRTTFYVRGRNLLDEEARRHTSFVKDDASLPGVTLLAGVRIQFN